MKREVLGFAGTIVFGALVACSGGAGAPDFSRGPDNEPTPSTDTPGDGREAPGTPNEPPGTPGEAPGASANEPANACFNCGGTYVCNAPAVAGSTTSYVTLVTLPTGCAVVDDQGNVSAQLVCGGQFLSIDNGQTALVGSWSGGTGRFRVTAILDGQTIVVDCALTNNAPPPQQQTQPQPGSGTNDTIDAG